MEIEYSMYFTKLTTLVVLDCKSQPQEFNITNIEDLMIN